MLIVTDVHLATILLGTLAKGLTPEQNNVSAHALENLLKLSNNLSRSHIQIRVK